MAKQNGLNKPDIDFNYNLIKGKLEENIIEQLFQALKFKVYPYGIENVIPDFRLIKEMDYGKQKDETIESIKNTPDYFVCSDELGKFLIEVKYRSNGKLEYEIFEDYPFPLVYVLFVTKNKIKITTIKRLKQN